MFQPTSLQVMECEWPMVGSPDIPSEKYDVLVVLPKKNKLKLTSDEDEDLQLAVDEWSPLEEEDDPRFSYLLRWLHRYLMKDEGLKPEVLGVYEDLHVVLWGAERAAGARSCVDIPATCLGRSELQGVQCALSFEVGWGNGLNPGPLSVIQWVAQPRRNNWAGKKG